MSTQTNGQTNLLAHPVIQTVVPFLSLCVAATAIVFAVRTTSEDRNARLVEIGVNILTVDPSKQTQIDGARKWALDLIDANAGGVKFSREARQALLERRLYTEPFAGPASVEGVCQIFKRPEYVIRGQTREDQYWIDLTIESGVAGCGWPRPKALPQSN